jgi:precorrin-2 dehydrogenase/sirohydrochlorin ferrochelatase
VTVVALGLSEEQKHELTSAGIKIIEKDLAPEDVQNQFLIYLFAIGNKKFTQEIYNATREKRVLFCAVDQPEFCDVVNVSIFEQGHLRITISTDGAAPAVSKKIRQGLEASLKDSGLKEYLDDMARLREQLEQEGKSSESKMKTMLAAAEDFKFKAVIELPNKVK